uniref:Transient receptor potential cation channel subfamily A member 1 n=1 Tax=Lygus hesperus TaxID=30085 RepID=A0A0A9WBS1_LYGHE
MTITEWKMNTMITISSRICEKSFCAISLSSSCDDQIRATVSSMTIALVILILMILPSIMMLYGTKVDTPYENLRRKRQMKHFIMTLSCDSVSFRTRNTVMRKKLKQSVQFALIHDCKETSQGQKDYCVS